MDEKKFAAACNYKTVEKGLGQCVDFFNRAPEIIESREVLTLLASAKESVLKLQEGVNKEFKAL